MTVVASKYAPKKNDLYETEPWAAEALIRALVQLNLWRNGVIWEPAAGNHALARPCLDAGAEAIVTSDIATYDCQHTFMFDFLTSDEAPLPLKEFDLITNPPYGRSNRLAVKFAERALERCDGFVALLLTAKFDFGSSRKHLFRDCERFCAKVALLDRVSWEGNGETGTEDHAWYIWGPRTFRAEFPKILYQRNPLKEKVSGKTVGLV